MLCSICLPWGLHFVHLIKLSINYGKNYAIKTEMSLIIIAAQDWAMLEYSLYMYVCLVI